MIDSWWYCTVLVSARPPFHSAKSNVIRTRDDDNDSPRRNYLLHALSRSQHLLLGVRLDLVRKPCLPQLLLNPLHRLTPNRHVGVYGLLGGLHVLPLGLAAVVEAGLPLPCRKGAFLVLLDMISIVPNSSKWLQRKLTSSLRGCSRSRITLTTSTAITTPRFFFVLLSMFLNSTAELIWPPM